MTAPSIPAELSRARRMSWMAAGGGLLVLLLGAFVDPRQFFLSYLWSWWLWLGAGIGCLQLLMIQQLTGGWWGFASYRVLETGARTIAPMGLLAIPLLFGVPLLFPWASDPALLRFTNKALYLNTPFLAVRLVIYFAIWCTLAALLARWSDAEDRTGDPAFRLRRQRTAGPGIIFTTLAAAFAAVDWMMSLEPQFYSSMYPLIHVVGQGLTALAIVILAVRLLAGREPLRGVADARFHHDIGNLLFAFTALWAYVQFSQLLIVWAGNLPKEIPWYLVRTAGGWEVVAVLLAVFHFVVPFGLLLVRRNKRDPRRLAMIAAFVLLMRAVDVFYMAAPAHHRSAFCVHWMDLAAPVGLGGLWAALLLWRLGSRPLLPAHDPRFAEAAERTT